MRRLPARRLHLQRVWCVVSGFEGRPYVIELLGGGEHDGRRFERPDLPAEWRVPVAPSISELLAPHPPDTYVVERHLRFRRTGRVTDDGAHLYSLEVL